MDEIAERAAGAAYEWFRHNFWVDSQPPWAEISPSLREPWVAAQRASIAAMREPTEAMLRAAPEYREVDLYPLDVWHTMIDAALGGGAA